jgi:hypothetical protein
MAFVANTPQQKKRKKTWNKKTTRTTSCLHNNIYVLRDVMPETVQVGDAREDEVVKAKRFGSKHQENEVCTKRVLHPKPPTLHVPKTSPNLGPQFEYFSVFLGIYLNFQRQYITSKSISPTF